MKRYKEIQLKFIHSLFQFYFSLLLSYRKQLAYTADCYWYYVEEGELCCGCVSVMKKKMK